MFRRATILCAVLFPTLLPTAAAAQTTRAEDFANLQDFGAAPPTLGLALRDILWFVRPNRTYDSSGPPFASPRPPLPQHVVYAYARCRSGSHVTSSDPRCVKTWSDCFVWLRFDDGSDWSFEQYEETERCSDGSSNGFTKLIQVADAGPSWNRDYRVRVQSYARDDLQTSRRYGCAAGAGDTVSFAQSASRPVVSGGAFVVTIGPGGTLDLRQNAAAGGPLFATDGPALLRCDTILMDPGVTLTDLFSVPPIVLPGASLAELELGVPAFLSLDDAAPADARITLRNPGNAADTVLLSWTDTRGWFPPGQVQLSVPAGGITTFDLPVQVPPAALPGDLDVVQVQAVSQQNPGASQLRTLRIAHDPAGVFRFGAGTAGCLGPHGMDADRALAAGGPPTRVTCAQAPPGAPALWLFGVDVGPGYGTLLFPGLPAELYVDPLGALFVTAFTFADPTGTVPFALQIPANPELRALQLVAQALVLWPAPCPPGPDPVSSSPALGLVVQ